MVHNLNQILDESEIKNVDECIMPEKENYMIKCYNKPNRHFKKREWSDEMCDYVTNEYENNDQKPWFPKLKYWFSNDQRKLSDEDYKGIYTEKRRRESWMAFQNENLEEIHNYLNITPFTPCMMFNISPNWKGKIEDPLTRKMSIKKFCKVIDLYLNNCNRYSKWKYCIESGSEDNFIHAHIVAEINNKMINSVLNGKNSHVRKGNHIAELRKIWDKEMPEGYVGYLKGKFAIQSIILRNEVLRDDKLKYLIEENKPEGHKNKVDLGLIFGEL